MRQRGQRHVEAEVKLAKGLQRGVRVETAQDELVLENDPAVVVFQEFEADGLEKDEEGDGKQRNGQESRISPGVGARRMIHAAYASEGGRGRASGNPGARLLLQKARKQVQNDGEPDAHNYAGDDRKVKGASLSLDVDVAGQISQWQADAPQQVQECARRGQAEAGKEHPFPKAGNIHRQARNLSSSKYIIRVEM